MYNGKIITMRASDGSIVNMEVYDTLPSTVQLARDYAKRGYPDRYVVFAEKCLKPSQTRTEGEYESGVFMSLILRPSLFPSQAALLGALSATSLAEALAEHTTKNIGLGWVSDVYCNGVKIGDTQIEGMLDNFASYEYIIVTYRARLDAKNFPPKLTDMIRKVFESENTSVNMIVARNVISKFFKLYPQMKTSRRFMELYSKRFILRGKNAKYIFENRKKSCKILGIDQHSGALIIELKHGEVKHINSPKSVVLPKRVYISSNNQL